MKLASISKYVYKDLKTLKHQVLIQAKVKCLVNSKLAKIKVHVVI